jgi:bacillithiol biosynthesis cysteine-adding enzyme BshC
MIPFAKYPGLSPLFLDFLNGLPEFYPDPPTLDAAAERGRQLLAAGKPARVPASAFRTRGSEAARFAQELAAGRAVAVSAGHQVGLFTGPLFTVMKAFDAIHMARALSQRGVPAVPVFWALTDDHDLQEIARTARPGPEGPQELLLEGADRQNRQPVGRLPIPESVGAIVDAFRPDANEDTEAILDAFARRSAPGTAYGEAFIEMLLDLVDPDPLLVLDPLSEPLRAPTVALFREAVRQAPALRQALEATAAALRAAGKPVPAPVPEDFSFFAIDHDGRRRIAQLPEASARVESGQAWPSADVITRPVLKSYLFPMAASVLGAAEIAYHAQSLPLFRLFGVPQPVLIPRTHVILRGPAERRLAEQLGVPEQDLLSAPAEAELPEVPEAGAVTRLAQATEENLSALASSLVGVDGSLSGALDTTKKKVAYQFEQLAERIRKAAERKVGVASNRGRRLAQALLPGGVPAERVYPPLSPMLTYGREVLEALRRAAGRSTEGAVVVDLGETTGAPHAG